MGTNRFVGSPFQLPVEALTSVKAFELRDVFHSIRGETSWVPT